AFVLVSSFSWRDPLILDGSDLVFRLVPLWLAFTPAGDRWSVDALRRNGAPVARGWALPIRILELQIAWIYLATGLEKLGGIDWIDGTAAYYALQLEHTFARPWAYAFAVSPIVSHLISWYTIAVELTFLPLAMLPSRLTRRVAALSAAAMHVGILLFMNVGNFPLVMLASCVLFVPSQWIERVMPGSAALAVDPPRARPRAAGALLIVAAFFAFATAVPSMLEPIRPSGDLASALRSLSVDQRWDMFSPNAARSDGWLIVPATFADGTRLDLLSGRGADDRSERYSDPFYSRWAKVQERIASGYYAVYRAEYARHFCRTRNSHVEPGQSPLVSLDLIWVERTIQAPEKGPPLISENTLWSQQC
ncbi:MAG: HTTM domain-containing protein, partial [Chloroflexota bacterium]|nr:HTTM domain-containing protein [Chloroflexota bacterium]